MLRRVNKAFTKEDEADVPDLVPARAPLPDGTPNYVTARGLDKLKAELKDFEEARARLDTMAEGADRTRALAHLGARRNALDARLASAMLVDSANQPRDEVRFGARVSVRPATGPLRTYKIVGVDEAEPTTGLVAFVAPLARGLLGKGVGDLVKVRTPRGEDEFEIVRIDYDDPGADPVPNK
jgi:transcription elongation factor GreB